MGRKSREKKRRAVREQRERHPVYGVHCPQCGAAPGQLCVASESMRGVQGVHKPRRDLADRYRGTSKVWKGATMDH